MALQYETQDEPMDAFSCTECDWASLEKTAPEAVRDFLVCPACQGAVEQTQCDAGCDACGWVVTDSVVKGLLKGVDNGCPECGKDAVSIADN